MSQNTRSFDKEQTEAWKLNYFPKPDLVEANCRSCLPLRFFFLSGTPEKREVLLRAAGEGKAGGFYLVLSARVVHVNFRVTWGILSLYRFKFSGS